METIITLLLNDQEINQLKAKYSPSDITYDVDYTLFRVRTQGCTITVYTSRKVVFSGKNAALHAQPFDHGNRVLPKAKKTATPPKTTIEYPMAGSDEVGTGDYFGPVCVCACIVEEKDLSVLAALNIMDSKLMNDLKIRECAPVLMKQLAHSILILNNEKYNEVHKTNNMNEIKAKLHNQAYLNLSRKRNLPPLMIIDQFMPERAYYRALSNEPEIIKSLHFETKAENKYIAVACASVIARYAFLLQFDKMDEAYTCSFPKGAGPAVDRFAQNFSDHHGFEALYQVAKVHFKNTDKINH